MNTMNDRQQLLERYEKMKIGTDEPFRFHCTQCGECCIHRDDILLSPKDLFQIARKLQLTPAEALQRYCESYIGADSRIPIVRLKPEGRHQRCPFLKNNRCRIHDVKPSVCALFPIGRCLKISQDSETHEDFQVSQIEYIFTDPGCGNAKTQHTVREWFDTFHIPLEDHYFVNWNNVVCKFSQLITDIEEKSPEDFLQTLWNAFLFWLYLNYDIGLDFSMQFQKNSEKFQELFPILNAFSEHGSDKEVV